MTRVVDASVACKWFFEETGSKEARDTLTAGPVVAPDLIVAEVANVAWRRIVQGEIRLDQAEAALAGLITLMDELVPCATLAKPALAMACKISHPAYDCFYVALAEAREAILVTDDRTLLRRVARTRWEPLVTPLLH